MNAQSFCLRAVAAILALAACTQGMAGEDFAKLDLPPFTVGVCNHFRPRHDGGLREQSLAMMRRAGITSSRDEAAWKLVEKEKGKYELPAFYATYLDAVAKFDIAPLNILLYSNPLYDNDGYPRSPEAVAGYAAYCSFIVKTLGERCRMYQVWNEWDGGCGMKQATSRGDRGDPATYVKLLAAAYPVIKAANPKATVISNSICTGDPALEATLKEGLLQHCDVVALHTYNYARPAGSTPEAWLTRMIGVDKMLRRYSGGKEVPLFVTEMGWPTHISGNGTADELSGTYLARLYLLARTLPYIKGIWWYEFEDDGRNPEYNENNFGMVQFNDLTPKPAYHALAGVGPLVAAADFVERMDAGDPDVWVLRFRYRDPSKAPHGPDAIAVWSTHPDDRWQVTFEHPQANAKPVQLRRVGNPADERRWDQFFSTIGKAADRRPGSFLRVTVGGRPWIFEGDLEGVKIVDKAVCHPYPEMRRPRSAILLLPEAVATAAPRAKEGAAPMVPFGAARNYRLVANADAPYSPADLDASFKLSYDLDHLYLTVAVKDDKFHQPFKGADTWQGDGLQVAFKSAKIGGDAAHGTFTELDVALVDGAPKVYRHYHEGPGANVELPAERAAIARDGDAVTYRLTLPVNEIGLPQLHAGDVIGFSLLVNDNDGEIRKGYLHWGDGIGNNKDATRYNLVIMGE